MVSWIPACAGMTMCVMFYDGIEFFVIELVNTYNSRSGPGIPPTISQPSADREDEEVPTLTARITGKRPHFSP